MTGQQLKNSILQWAIEGKLVPQIESEGTAEDLLKEIRAEKEKLVKEGKLKKKDLEVKPIEDDEIPFEIPDGWKWCRLGTLASFVVDCPHSTPQKSACVTNHPCIRTSEIKGGVIVWDSMQYLDESNYQARISRLKPQEGDIVYAREGAYGDAVILPNTHEFCLGQRTMMLRMALRSITEYVHKAIISPFVYSQAVKLNREGTTSVGHVNLSDIVNFIIPLPPLSEQRRIVSKIEELMPLVEEYGKAQERLEALNKELPERLKKSVLQEAIMGKLVPQDPKEGTAEELLEEIRKEKEKLVKEGKLKKKDLEVKPIEDDEIPFEIPKSWKWCRLGEIGSWGSGATPAKGKPEYYTNGNIPWLRTGELNNDYVYDSEIKVTQAALDECSLRMCRKGDVLIAMYGATIGKVAIAGIELTTNQACCACTPLLIYNKYLMWYLMASKQAFIDLGEGGAQPNISREKIVAFPFALPPLAEQKRIVEKVEEVMGEIEGMK